MWLLLRQSITWRKVVAFENIKLLNPGFSLTFNLTPYTKWMSLNSHCYTNIAIYWFLDPILKSIVLYDRAGVARLFWSRAKFEKYFPSRAALFKIGHNICVAEKNLGFLRGSMNSFSLNLSTCTAFSKTKGCPRAAKISWRAACGPQAALWPRLAYGIKQGYFLPIYHHRGYHQSQIFFLSNGFSASFSVIVAWTIKVWHKEMCCRTLFRRNQCTLLSFVLEKRLG